MPACGRSGFVNTRVDGRDLTVQDVFYRDLALGHLMGVQPNAQVRVHVAAEKDIADARGHCDVVAQVVQNGRIVGYLYDPAAGNFIPDDNSAPLSDAALRSLAAMPGQEVTSSVIRLLELCSFAMTAPHWLLVGDWSQATS